MWHRGEDRFYWVDIHGNEVFRLGTDGVEAVYEGRRVTAVVEMGGGGIAMVTDEGLLALRDGETTRLIEWSMPERVRPNDGKCDPAGRLWFGTMDLETTDPLGELFVCDGGRRSLIRSGIVLSNGLGWSPDGSVLYHIDSMRRHIYRHDFDLATGEVSGRAVLVDMEGGEEVPDGLAVDVDGNLWVAMYDGWRIQVFDAEGTAVRSVDLDVQKPTSVAFGGCDLDSLYVTTASENLGPDELAAQPLAGAVLRFDPGTSGVPVGVFSPDG